MKNLLEKLTQAFGPSGYEKEIRDLIITEIQPYADEIRVDTMGNLFARKGSIKEGGKRIMISAHMDEIGLMASHVTEEGFVYVAAIGGVNPLTCFSGRVRFINGVEGVIYAETEKMNKVPTLSQLFVDVGATSKEDCPVKPGDIAVFDRPFTELNNRWVSKALDDRVGCLVAIEALKQLGDTANEVWFVFSVQEEVGCRGARVSAYSVDPDMGIALDVTLTGDLPHGNSYNMMLGSGPCIKVRDNMLIAHPTVIAAMQDAAEKAQIPVQMEVLRSSGTDAGVIQLSRSGVPSGCISLACRYVHSPSEMVDKRDVENAIKLLISILEN